MSVEQIVREILEAVKEDVDLYQMYCEGCDPQSFTSGNIVGPANRLAEILRRRTPPPATANLIRFIRDCLDVAGVGEVIVDEESARAILAEWE